MRGTSLFCLDRAFIPKKFSTQFEKENLRFMLFSSTPLVSLRTFGVVFDNKFYSMFIQFTTSNKHQGQMGSQPGDCAWQINQLNHPHRVCVSIQKQRRCMICLKVNFQAECSQGIIYFSLRSWDVGQM